MSEQLCPVCRVDHGQSAPPAGTLASWARNYPEPRRMQCKDIPDQPILDFIVSLNGRWATWFPGFANSVQNCMPAGVPDKLARAKMRKLIRRGVVDGCDCGCRGDYRLPDWPT